MNPNFLSLGYINFDKDESVEDLNSINDSDSIKFELEIDQDFQQCFFYNFMNNSQKDLDLDIESPISNLNEKKNSEICYSFSTENKEKTLDKSGEKSFLICIEKDLPSNCDSEKKYIHNDINNKSINNLTNNKEEVGINICEKQEKPEKKIFSDFLGKKKKIFRISKSTRFNKSGRFKIFIISELFQNIRKKINQILEDIKNVEEKKISSKTQKKQIKKKIKKIFKRKGNADNIRKKIKARFLKALLNRVNKRLKFAGSKKYFKNLPQKFVSNISKKPNKVAFDLSFKELFSQNYFKGKTMSNIDSKKYKNNISTIEYLEKNYEISDISNYNIFKNMKLKDIFNEYFESDDFENEINNLINDNEKEKYISDYVIKAKYLNDFFSH